jgi:hypothetical protein
MIIPFCHPDVVPFAQILLDGLPVARRPILTARELSLCVELLGRGMTLQQALDRIQAQRPSLPFTPEAA